MNIDDYILNDIKPLSLTTRIDEAKDLFENQPITHFPVVEDGRLLGSFAEDDIHTTNSHSEYLSSIQHLLNVFYTENHSNILELLKLFADNDTNIIPVLDEQKNYLGYFELRDVLDVFSTSPFMVEEKETIIVEKLEKDYSMSEVVQIVEATGGKLLGCYISEKKEDRTQVTLKVIADDINEIMQTFRRYNYDIISSHENDAYLEDLKNRSDYLKRYLEM